jgi:hypothetical protein
MRALEPEVVDAVWAAIEPLLPPVDRSHPLGCHRRRVPDRLCFRAWHAREVVRSLYDHHDPDLALEFVTRLGHDLQDEDCPPEVRQLGRTIMRWREQIAAWHQAHVSNGTTEAANNLIKRVKRVAFGFRHFAHYRIRVLRYAGRPNWDLLATVTPRWGGMPPVVRQQG